jgi:hypothetical protein
VKFTRHFYVNNQYGIETWLDYAEEHLRFVHGEAQHPQPYAMFCPTCGEIWARMPVDGSNREWRIIGGYCEQHPGASRYVVHGSLMLAWEPELTEILPDEVIRREFELHMRLWDKETENGTTT